MKDCAFFDKLGLAEKTRKNLAETCTGAGPADMYRWLRKDPYRWDKILAPATSEEVMDALWELMTLTEKTSVQFTRKEYLEDKVLRTLGAFAFFVVIGLLVFVASKDLTFLAVSVGAFFCLLLFVGDPRVHQSVTYALAHFKEIADPDLDVITQATLRHAFSKAKRQQAEMLDYLEKHIHKFGHPIGPKNDAPAEAERNSDDATAKLWGITREDLLLWL